MSDKRERNKYFMRPVSKIIITFISNDEIFLEYGFKEIMEISNRRIMFLRLPNNKQIISKVNLTAECDEMDTCYYLRNLEEELVNIYSQIEKDNKNDDSCLDDVIDESIIEFSVYYSNKKKKKRYKDFSIKQVYDADSKIYKIIRVMFNNMQINPRFIINKQDDNNIYLCKNNANNDNSDYEDVDIDEDLPF